ncbi:MAG: S-adenosyl-l-methionine hydroxide adenosyltransferase family protein [Chloroflexia bacterium]
MALNIYESLLAGLKDRLERLERPPVITITTDFGQYDGYVGTMKGVIYTLLPDAVVVDISHDVSPQQIHEGAFILYRAYRYFPASAIHIAVVDPGVGSERRPILLQTRHGIFVGPDNGIFTYVLRAEQIPLPDPNLDRAPIWAGGMWGVAPNWAGDESGTEMPAGAEHDYPEAEGHASDGLPKAYHLVNPDYWLPTVSSTFHARDIFVPVATHLASGAQPERMGKRIRIDSLVTLPLNAPRVAGSGRGTTILGQVVHVDRFGNIITNLPDALLGPMLADATAAPVVEIGDHRIFGLGLAYADVREGQPVALMGSEGLLEIAVRNSNAAQRMKIRPGDPVRIILNRLEDKPLSGPLV